MALNPLTLKPRFAFLSPPLVNLTPRQVRFKLDDSTHSPQWLMGIFYVHNVVHSYLRVLNVFTVLTLIKIPKRLWRLKADSSLRAPIESKHKLHTSNVQWQVHPFQQGKWEATKKRLDQSQTETQQGKQEVLIFMFSSYDFRQSHLGPPWISSCLQFCYL